MQDDYMDWDEKYAEILRDIIESAELDETTGEVVLSGPWGENGLADEARFQSLYDIEELRDVHL